MRVVQIRRHGQLEGTVRLDDGAELLCPLSVLADFGLRKGQELSPNVLAQLCRESLRWRIRHAALRFLARRAHSRRELHHKLLRKFPGESELVEPVLQALTQEGYLDDAAYAEAFIRQRLERSAASPARLIAELRQRGVDGELAVSIVQRYLPDSALIEQARRAAARKLRSLHRKAPEQQWRALAGYLGRQGFPAAVIRRVLQESFPDTTGAENAE
ncbi:MAG: recombination regulator RecX [Candidatus Kapabacteria bacterium]|nr:recombination regulator RecX [Candidatus Kapabacteria bacterium]MCS7170278.1 recombination regulator RecX [Candidatus Kapabacteria bacterium]MDW7997143.1 regulatory protein RecX [Bacteroidota bacterium]MDW8224605.1 regulatory protein RecX [Bacteroidota bacterium]